MTRIHAQRPNPREHQLAALDALTDAYTDHSRAQIRMAWGTGKTLVGPWLAERLSIRTVAVFCPSIALVAQIIDQWKSSGVPVRALAVCSDPTTRTGRDEIGPDGVDPFAAGRDRDGVTTRPEVVRRFLTTADHTDHITLLVSTYHSASTVAAAVNTKIRNIGLVIADEAHHLAGRIDQRFLPVLDDRALPARYRLFQTATPLEMNTAIFATRIDQITGAAPCVRSMDDHETFGPIAYNLPAGEAITRGLLAPYRVVVGVPALESALGTGPSVAALSVLDDSVSRYGLRRVLSFHTRVGRAHEFADRINELGVLGGVPARAFAVSAAMRDRERRVVLDELAASPPGTVTVVASARCLCEGVDVPAVDAVEFADPRSSATSIMQSVGRALRPHPDKQTGTIIVPIVMETDDDDQARLADSAFQHVWRVLRGLRAHDDRIAADLDRARARIARGPGSTGRVQNPPEWLTVLGDDPSTILARLLERSSQLWDTYYGLLSDIAQSRGGALNVKTNTIIDGKRVGQWTIEQRSMYGRGLLSQDRIDRLEKIPGWYWTTTSAADRRTLAKLDRIVAERGSLTENTSGKSIFEGKLDGLRRPLGHWVAAQIFKFRDGQLDPGLRTELEQRPGWTWHPLDAEDEAPFEAFRAFAAWEGHGDMASDHIENDQPVGEWLSGVRRRKVLGTISPSLETMLLAAVPPDPDTGTRRFTWKTHDVQWDLGIEAAQQFIARTGNLAELPVDHVETIDGHPVGLYRWVRRVRRSGREGSLDADRVAQVEALTGWEWSGGRYQRKPCAPLDLGATPHSIHGYRKGCSCTICLTEFRSYSRQTNKTKAAEFRANWADATDAAEHLRSLMVAAEPEHGREVVSVGAIAAAAEVSSGTVRTLIEGTATRCHPLHRLALLKLTIPDVLAVRTVPGSRGRRRIAGHGQLVDPGPTWEHLDRLTAAGWSQRQIAAALGYQTPRPHIARDRVTAAQARMVQLLMDTLGEDLTPPSGLDRAPIYKLDQAAEDRALELLEQGHSIAATAAATELPEPIVAAVSTRISGNRAA